MGERRAVTVRLEADDYARLQGEARRLGVSTGTLARVYVRAGLGGEPAEARQLRAGLAALDRLAELNADLVPVDAIRIARDSRRELDRRPSLE